MIRTHKLPLAIALALGSSAAHALGLGAIEVRSGLNEPLVAEIPLNEAFPGEAAEVKVGLAKAEDFARVGLDQSSLTVPLAFDLVDGGAGGPRIQVTSDMPVREPFLSFLVEVTWPNGRLLREYSVLLDPPGVAPAVIGTRTVVEPLREAAPAEAAPEALPESSVVPSEPVAEPIPPAEPVPAEAAPAEPAPGPAPEPTAEPAAPAEPAPEPAPQPEPAPAPMAAAPSEYGPVASGETLWEIASSTRPSDAVTLNQMMVAILRMNPDAFGDGNANQLKRGAVLRIPTVDEAQAVAIADAAAEIAAQNQAWQAARGTTLVADAAFGSGRSTPVDGDADSRLELVPPRSGDGGAGGADRPGVAGGTDAAVEADLQRAREQLASREQESGELRSRVAELERIQRDNERLVTLKNSEIADLQRRLEEAEQAAAAARQAAADAETRVATAAQVPPPPEPLPTPVAEPSPIAAEPAPSPAESPVAVESPVAAEPVPSPAETPVDAAVPADAAVAADAGATPVESPSETPVETPVAAEVTPLPEPSPVSEAPPAVVEEDRPPMPWWRQTWALAAGGGAIVALGLLLLLTRGRKKPEPAAESRSSVADSFGSGVFGAGGAAAAGAIADDGEGALLDRLAADPTDLEAHLELLRHHYAGGDTEKFEAAAGAMYAQVIDPSVPQWQDALAMGRALLPDHPLFADLSEASERAVAPSSYADSAFDFDAVESAATAAPAQADSERDFDFSLEAPEPPKAADFSFDVEVAKPDESAFRTQEIERPNFDFDMAAPTPPPVAVAPAPQPAPASAPADAGFFDGEDTVGTKLDLARAYLDMGDPEGARSMLQEVITEGDDAQKAEARRLLAEIG